MGTGGGSHRRFCTVAVVLVVACSGIVAGVGVTTASSAHGTATDVGVGPATATLVVDGDADGDDEYATIQAAVDTARAGATIRVEAGTYNETVRIAKPLTLVGAAGDAGPGPGPTAPVLDGGGRTGSAITVANGTADVVIGGFEIRNYSRGEAIETGNGVVATGRSLRNVTVHDTSVHHVGRWGIGIGSFGGGGPENLTLVDNRIENAGVTALQLTNVRTVTVSGNRIAGGRSIDGSGNASRAVLVRAVGQTGVGRAADLRVVDNTVTGRFDGPFSVVGVVAEARAHDASLTTATVANTRVDVEIPRQRPVAAVSIGAINESAAGRARLDGVRARNTTAIGTHDGVRVTAGNDARVGNVTVVRTRISNVRHNGVLVSSVGVPGGTPVTGRLEAIEVRANTIRRASTAVGVQVRGTGTAARLSVRDNDVTDTASDSLVFAARGGATLTDLRVRGNRITRGRAGITVRPRNDGTVEEVTVRNNTVRRSRYGVFLNPRHAGTLADVTVDRNAIVDSTRDGISVPAADQSRLRGLEISDNTVRGTDGDGIELIGDAGATVREVTVRGNRVLDNAQRGLLIAPERAAGAVVVTRNSFVGNDEFGVANAGDGIVNATNNWWGDASGPSSPDPATPLADPVTGALADGTGDAVSTGVRFDPWLTTDPDPDAGAGPGDVTGDGNPARDPDGDGLYEDVNGDGDATPGDATVLFDAVFEGNAVVTGNVDAFDFNRDGSVTPGDATVLFDAVF